MEIVKYSAFYFAIQNKKSNKKKLKNDKPKLYEQHFTNTIEKTK